MKQNKLTYFAILIILVIVYIAVSTINNLPVQEAKIVTRIVDGDTIVVEGGERVRLLDIDTPERGEKCYTEAKNRLAELIGGKAIILEKRGQDRDDYNRLLRYVIYNDTLINLQLVREGLANLYIYNKNTPYYNAFVEAEQAAKNEGLCVWQK